ncbi:MAG: CBS domain-containing protein [Nitrospirae bacterium]|nr:CBS domain-containing protein [Nitrospirota bacterium]
MVTAKQLMKQDLAKMSHMASALDAARIMKERRIGSVFVEQNARIVGIVTETDIVREVVGASLPSDLIRVRDIMSSPVVGIDERRPITEAADLMERSGTRHLAVLKSGDIVGVLSVRDLLHPVSIDEF